VQDRLRIAEANTATAEAAASKAQDESARQKATDEQAAEQLKIKKAIDAVAALRKEGKVADAQRQAQDLLKNYPDHVAVRVLNGMSTSVDAIGSDRAVRQEKDQAQVAIARDIERSAIPTTGDVEFPKDWKEKTERRLKGTRATQAELKMLQALAKPIPAEFKSVKLQEAMQAVSTAMDRTILIDPAALQENGITYELPVTLNARTLAARTVLRHLLSQVGLTYVIRDDVINVTTPGRARDMMVTKSYYIGDIVSGVGLFGGGAQWGPALDQVQLAQNVNAVIEMITSSVDPMSWNNKGGFGNIGFSVPTMSLIIRQSAEVHAMIGNGLLR
jgi:hypothetical protein